jgi:3'(2'), 5'-bisphosphate nucleotidase
MKDPLQLSPALLAQVVAIARQAGAEIMAVYRNGPVAAEKKADDSPLTQADLRAHRSIVTALHALTPQLPVLSEESAVEDFVQRPGWPCHWLVDPLDGTREFLARNGEFTVNIALIDGDTPVLGVVQLPTQDRVYTGARGLGAQRIEADGTASSIHVQRPAQSPLRVLGSRSHGNEAMGAVLARLGPHELLTVGSSIKFCFVAEGAADLYPRMGPTSEWDTAAGHAVLEAAGGGLRRLGDGEPLRYNGGEDFLNPQFVAYGDQHSWDRWQVASAS